jgi:hypothetical protein
MASTSFPPGGLYTASLGAAPGKAPLSPNALFLTGFFGGPLATSAVAGMNLHRAGRLARDWPLLALGLALGAAALGLETWAAVDGTAFTAALPEWLHPLRLERRASNFLGVAAAVAFYLRLRPAFRTAELSGGYARSWPIGLAALLGAWAVEFLVVVGTAVARVS